MPKRARPRSDPEHPIHRLLSSASASFSSRGFDQTSLEDIAAQAHLPRTGVYYYFPSKLALLVAVVEEVQARFHAQLDDIERADPPPERAVAEILRAHVRLICEDPAGMRVVVREADRLPPDTPEIRRIAGRRRLYRRRLGAFVDRGIEQGVFAPVDRSLAVEAIIAIANSVMAWLPSAGQIDPEAVAASCARLAIGALRQEGPDEGARRAG